MTNLNIIFPFGECIIWLTIKKNWLFVMRKFIHDSNQIQRNLLCMEYSTLACGYCGFSVVMGTWHSECDVDHNLYTSAKICNENISSFVVSCAKLIFFSFCFQRLGQSIQSFMIVMQPY